MSDKIFVHYPPCVSKKLEEKFDALVRASPTLCCFRDKVKIYSTAHSLKQVQAMEQLHKNNFVGSYLAYALLFMLTKRALPPAPGTLNRRPLYKEDRLKLHYHFRELDDCASGVFVPHHDGLWPFDMWRNAKRMITQEKPVMLIVGNEIDGWRIVPLCTVPERTKRLNRKQTLHRIGEYSEPFGAKEPPILTLFRRLFDEKND
jgi:hypothetical protein